jgi:hypothetical protein
MAVLTARASKGYSDDALGGPWPGFGKLPSPSPRCALRSFLWAFSSVPSAAKSTQEIVCFTPGFALGIMPT